MAKQIHGPLGGFVGKLGPLIGYRWRGRWCVRTRPQHVHNPRTEAQQRHRSLFRAEVQLAARMRWPIAMALTDEARRRHMTAQNLFVRLNHGLWKPADNPACEAAPDYSRLQLSTGRLEAVCGVRAEVDADGVLRVRFDRCRPEQRAYAYDEVFLYAYSPSAGAGYLFNSVYRRTGRIDVLPPDWLQTDDLQLYLMCRSSDGRWSATVHAGLHERLHADEFVVEAVGIGHKLVMGAALHNAAVVEHHDKVGMADGREAVGDDYGGAPPHDGVEALLHSVLALGVESRGGLV